MRNLLSLLFLVVFLGAALPAQAQLRQDVHAERAPAKLYDQSGPGFLLNTLFNPNHFRMSHSYELSMGSGMGSMGMYTNTMLWQFNQKLAARVDVGFMHTPFGGALADQLGMDQGGGKLLLRNAEVAYRPTENMQLHLSFRQSPYGGYMSPYGAYGGAYGSGASFRVDHGTQNMFWKDAQR